MSSTTDPWTAATGTRTREEALEHFFKLTVWEVEEEADVARARTSLGRTWLSLSNLMQRQGYRVVRDLGVPAATSWAVHLHIVER